MYLSRLKELSNRYYIDNKHEKQEIPGLSVLCWLAHSAIEA